MAPVCLQLSRKPHVSALKNRVLHSVSLCSTTVCLPILRSIPLGVRRGRGNCCSCPLATVVHAEKSHASFHRTSDKMLQPSFGHNVSKVDRFLKLDSRMRRFLPVTGVVTEMRRDPQTVASAAGRPPSALLSCLAFPGRRIHLRRQTDPRSHPRDLPLRTPSRLRPPQGHKGAIAPCNRCRLGRCAG